MRETSKCFTPAVVRAISSHGFVLIPERCYRILFTYTNCLLNACPFDHLSNRWVVEQRVHCRISAWIIDQISHLVLHFTPISTPYGERRSVLCLVFLAGFGSDFDLGRLDSKIPDLVTFINFRVRCRPATFLVYVVNRKKRRKQYPVYVWLIPLTVQGGSAPRSTDLQGRYSL